MMVQLGIDIGDASEHIGHQVNVCKRGGIASLGQLVIGRSVNVVENRPW